MNRSSPLFRQTICLHNKIGLFYKNLLANTHSKLQNYKLNRFRIKKIQRTHLCTKTDAYLNKLGVSATRSAWLSTKTSYYYSGKLTYHQIYI